jgi:hypothetical protein
MIGHMLCHMTIPPPKFKRIEVVKCIFYNYNEIKLKLIARKKPEIHEN